MRTNLVEGILDGTIDIDSLTDDEQEQVLKDYNQLANHWAQSPKPELREFALLVLEMLEMSGLIDEEVPKNITLH